MSTWYSADLHFGHELMIKKQLRPFSSVHEMDEYITDTWNSWISPNDDVWLLGDIVMSPWIEESLAKVAALNGVIHLVPGNHDLCWAPTDPRELKRLKQAMRYRHIAGIEHIIQEPDPHTIAGHTVHLSHFPFEADHTPTPRYMQHRPSDTGDWLLHGHIHSMWRQHHKQINVGIDAWAMMPVHIDEISQMINDGPADPPLDILPVPGV